MIVSIIAVDIEVGKPGAKGWSKATVLYNVNGEQKRQNIMSFINPAVYKAVQQHIGETVEVSITKNAKGYDEWAAVSPVSGTASVAGATTVNSSGPPTRVTGSNYETPVERAKRQVLIVRQSSLSAAQDFLKNKGEPYDFDDLTNTAQQLVDWVFDEGDADGPTE